MQDLITVIVPIYKVEKYLKRCIESIINQTYKKIEIILVDDGSPDLSGKLCDAYAKQDNRIIVIHKDNAGVSVARNIGIDNAHGKYITFIDSDDYVDTKYIESLYFQCVKNDAEISVTGTRDFLEDTNIIVSTSRKFHKNLRRREAIKEFLKEKNFYCVIWGKMYKKEIWQNVRFDKNIKIAEDLEVMYKLLKKVDKVSINTGKLLYFYNCRDTSITSKAYNKDFEREIDITEHILEDVKDNYHSIYNYAVKRYVRINLTCIMKYFKEYGNIEEKDYLFANLKKYKFRKYIKTTIKEKIKLIIVLYFRWILKYLI